MLETELSTQTPHPAEAGRFFPMPPEDLADTGLAPVLLEDLMLKMLLGQGVLTGRDLALALCLPFKLLVPLLSEMKARTLVAHRTTAPLGDFFYQLTDLGKQTALRAREHASYVGPAPVVWADYVQSVHQQSIRLEKPTPQSLEAAFADVVVDPEIVNVLGPAMHAGRGIFLFGEPGNGKSTIAERIRHCFAEGIYIPRTLWVDGELIQLFDPQTHELLPVREEEKRDTRWVKIKRPSITVGGELTLEALELQYSETAHINEAPLQMKANGGIFIIDDFGRQRVNHADLLNRWIVPLEKRHDFLMLSNGQKIQVPFDPLIVFSTNLSPKTLVDEAFLRRIPYKIEVSAPDETTFRRIFEQYCLQNHVTVSPEVLERLIQDHYVGKRPFKACHPRDLGDQVRHICAFRQAPLEMTSALLDEACHNYFGTLDS